MHCLRLNPGNIRRPEHIKLVAPGVQGPRRADPHRRERRLARPRRSTRSTAAGSPPRPWSSRPSSELAYFDEVGFDDVKISVKASNVPLMIEAYRQLSEVTDHPLHLGVTEAGPAAGRRWSRPPPASPRCWPRASATPSATRSPPIRSRRRAPGGSCSRPWACGSARASTSSPARRCGRAEVDVIEVGQRGAGRASATASIPLQVAVMGCVVNGPGEARDADLGIAAGRKQGHLFVKGATCAVVPEDEMVDALVEWAEFIGERRRRGGAQPTGRPRRRPSARPRSRPGGAARRAGRRRQRLRAAGRADPLPGREH